MVGLTGLDSLAGLVWCRVVFLQSWLCEAEQLCQHVEIKLRKRGTMPKNQSCDWLMVRAVSCDWSVVCGV